MKKAMRQQKITKCWQYPQDVSLVRNNLMITKTPPEDSRFGRVLIYTQTCWNTLWCIGMITYWQEILTCLLKQHDKHLLNSPSRAQSTFNFALNCTEFTSSNMQLELSYNSQHFVLCLDIQMRCCKHTGRDQNMCGLSPGPAGCIQGILISFVFSLLL